MKNTLLAENFGTLSETINGLIKLGYTHDFNVKDDSIICNNLNSTLSPIDFKIDKVYRFEGESDPEYQSILYAISSLKNDIKGTIVNGYGTSSDDAINKLIEKLSTHKEEAINRLDTNQNLNPTLLEIDLPDYINQLKNEKKWVDSDRNSVTVFKSDTMRIVLLGLKNNAEIKSHQATGVISVQVLEGRITFITEDKKLIIEKGQMVALQQNIIHSVHALAESFFLLTLSINK